jgi:hypothetical protein
VEQLYKEEEKYKEKVEGLDEEDQKKVEEEVQQVPPRIPRKRVQKNHPLYQFIRNKNEGVETRRRICSPEQINLALLSTIEPNFFEESNKDELWNKAMDE